MISFAHCSAGTLFLAMFPLVPDLSIVKSCFLIIYIIDLAGRLFEDLVFARGARRAPGEQPSEHCLKSTPGQVGFLYRKVLPLTLHYCPLSHMHVVGGDLSVFSRPQDLYLGFCPLGTVEEEADLPCALRVEALDVPNALVECPPSRLVRNSRSDGVSSRSCYLSSYNGNGGAFSWRVCLGGREHDAVRCYGMC